jgi:hypothetical protein
MKKSIGDEIEKKILKFIIILNKKIVIKRIETKS